MTIKKEIIIAGLTRDCAHSLPGLLENLQKLALRFEKSHFIFLENDSLDTTKDVLKSFAAAHTDCHLEFYDKIGKQHPKRTDRLAFLRNRVLQIAKGIVAEPHNTYFLLMDMDGANTITDSDRIADHIKNDGGSWAGLFANQRLDYCDLWALRHPTYCPYDIWEKVRNRPASMDKKTAVDTFITSIRFTLPEDAGLIEVDSAFGGLGLYRFSALQDCKYVGLDKEGEEICEHVAFNNAIRNQGGKLFIDAGLINAEGNEAHAPKKTKWQKKLDKVRLFFSQL